MRWGLIILAVTAYYILATNLMHHNNNAYTVCASMPGSAMGTVNRIADCICWVVCSINRVMGCVARVISAILWRRIAWNGVMRVSYCIMWVRCAVRCCWRRSRWVIHCCVVWQRGGVVHRQTVRTHTACKITGNHVSARFGK